MLVESDMIRVLRGDYKPWRALNGWKQLLDIFVTKCRLLHKSIITRSVMSTAERTVPATIFSNYLAHQKFPFLLVTSSIECCIRSHVVQPFLS
jgi:hypothetical protein